ncbi:MAG: M50 family metallopeptidase [Nitrososphaeraceae archaeon]
MLHTPFGLKFFDYVAKTRIARAYARANTYLMPVITAIMLFFLVLAISNMISSVSVREDLRELGPRANLLIPVINPLLPITYTLVALVISVFIHEAGHGIVARVYGLKVDSTGIAFILFIPVGAFVNLDRDELNKATLKQKSAVLTAGPLNNMILAGISFALLFVVLSSLTPISTDDTSNSGIELITVTKGSLAERIGLTEGSKILSIGQTDISSQSDLTQILRSNIGKQLPIMWQDKNGVQRSNTFSIPPDADPNKPILGVTAASADPIAILETYKKHPILLLQMPTQKSTPFSDYMAPKYVSNLIGTSSPTIANTLYWLFFINFNLGLFNALPISILDGGQLYGSLIESRSKIDKNRLNQISSAVSTITIAIVAMSLLLPYLPF